MDEADNGEAIVERADGPPSSGASGRVDGAGELMTSGDVARMFGVDPKTVARWADAGKLNAMRTLGGHRRYRPADVRSLLENGGSGLDDQD